MAQAFGFVAAGTEADGAAVEVVTVPAIVTCRDCGTSSESTDRLASCPTCHGTDVELSGGDELVLESIRYASAPSLPKIKIIIPNGFVFHLSAEYIHPMGAMPCPMSGMSPVW